MSNELSNLTWKRLSLQKKYVFMYLKVTITILRWYYWGKKFTHVSHMYLKTHVNRYLTCVIHMFLATDGKHAWYICVEMSVIRICATKHTYHACVWKTHATHAKCTKVTNLFKNACNTCLEVHVIYPKLTSVTHVFFMHTCVLVIVLDVKNIKWML